MTDEETVVAVMSTIATQLRTLGVVFHNDLGHKLRSGGAEEHRIIQIIARHVVQVTVGKAECQTAVGKSAP